MRVDSCSARIQRVSASILRSTISQTHDIFFSAAPQPLRQVGSDRFRDENAIGWQLDDFTGTALTSTALSAEPPVLSDWSHNFLLDPE